MIRSAVVALILALSAPSGNAFTNAALRTVSFFGGCFDGSDSHPNLFAFSLM